MNRFFQLFLWAIAIPAAGAIAIMFAPLLGIGGEWWSKTWPDIFCQVDQNMHTVAKFQERYVNAENESDEFAMRSAAKEMQNALNNAAVCGHEDSQVKLILMQCFGDYGLERNYAEAISIENKFNAINGYGSNLNVVDKFCDF